MLTNKVLLFDYDGVIVDSLPVICSAYNELFKKHGLNLHFTDDEFSKLYMNNFHDALKSIIPGSILKKILDEKGKLFMQKNIEFKAFNMMKTILAKLQMKNHVVIITSNTTKFVQENMKLNNLPALEVIGGDIEPSKVKKILDQKKKHPGAEIIYVGDTVGDVKEAKQAGVKSVAVTWGFHHRKLLEIERPDVILENPEELLKL